MSTELSDEPEPGPGNWLVRTFSDELSNSNSSDPLSRGLATKVAVDREHEKSLAALRDQWNSFLLEGREMAIHSVPSDEAFLLEQSRRLYAAWTKFCNRLPESQRHFISKDVPSLKQLHESVKEASESWDEERKGTKSGRLKDKFSSLCKTIEDHSALLSMIPTNDKYVCLLTGSFSAIAQASVNHADIAGGVADSLEELAQDMVFWNSVIQEHGHTDDILRCIMELYVVVFEFLTEIFNQWSRSSWRRLVTSLNEGAFHKLFSEKRTRMRAIEQKMLRVANLEFQKNMKRAVGHMQVNFETIMKNQECADLAQKNMIIYLGTRVQLLLDQSIRRPHLEETQSTEGLLLPSAEALSSPDASPNLGIESSKFHTHSPPRMEEHSHPSSLAWPETNLDDDHRFRREDVLRCLRPIAEAYGRDIQAVVDITSKAAKVAINPAVRQRIADWTSSSHSEALWVQGPRGVHCPSQNTLTAVCLVALSSQNEIPCLSYFCTLSSTNVSRASESSPKMTLLNLIKSFITQIILLLSDHILTPVDLSQNRFEQLTKDEENVDFNHALRLLHDLRSLVPSYLHCIIEGAHMLEDREDSSHTHHLRRVLEDLISFPSGEVEAFQDSQFKPPKDTLGSDVRRVIKVCFTTDGYVDSLAQLAGDDALGKIGYNDDSDQPLAEEGRRLMSHWSDGIE